MATEVKLIATGAVSASDLTLTTASAGTNDTSPATTAFVQQEITGLIDSAPDAMNTLNELAAALGDDANFSTTVTNSIATKLPLAGGTMTGNLVIQNDGGNEQFVIKRQSAQNEQLILGFHSSDYGTIQAVEQGVAYRPLILNPNGGDVGIGTTSPSGNLHVVGASGNAGRIYLSDADNGTGATDSLLITKSGTGASIYNRDSGNLNLGTNNDNDMVVITADGKLLVGTNSVGGVGVGGLKLYSNIEETLAIDGSAGTQAIHFHDNGTRRGIIGFSNGTSISSDLSDHDFVIRSETNLGFCTNTSSVQMYIDTSGKVGLGTQAPTHHLEALGTDSALIVHYSGQSRGGIAGLSGQRVVLTTTTSGDDIAFGYAGTTISSANFVSRMFIDNATGNVGIGTTSPSQKLNVNSGTTTTVAHFQSALGGAGNVAVVKVTASGNSSDGFRIIQCGSTSSVEGGANACTLENTENAPLLFGTNGTARMRIDSSGRVGINTTPSYQFDVRGQNSATNGHMVYMENNGGGGNGCTFSVQHADGNHSWGIVQELRIQSGSGTDNPSLLFSSGTESANTWTVGYGYTDVNFRIKRDHGYHNGNWGTSVFTMDRSGNVTISGSLTENSDERLKENIVTIPNALDKVSQLRGVTFDWKEKDDEGNVRNSMGLIAQEVEAVEGLEVLVTEVAKDGSPEMEEFQPKGVAYQNMVGLLIEAIKELKTENNDLKSRIETLEG